MRSRKKKGQLLSQPLFYILAMVVGALILAFGYKIIHDVLPISNGVLLQKWTKELDSSVQEMFFQDVGSTSAVSIALPSKIKYLCVKSTDHVNSFPSYLSQTDRVLINTNTGRNVFFVPVDAYPQNTAANVKNLKVKTEFECLPNGIKAILESQGDYVELHGK